MLDRQKLETILVNRFPGATNAQVAAAANAIMGLGDRRSSASTTVYVSSCGVKTVTAIDVQKMKELARIPVGEMPDRISTLALP